MLQSCGHVLLIVGKRGGGGGQCICELSLTPPLTLFGKVLVSETSTLAFDLSPPPRYSYKLDQPYVACCQMCYLISTALDVCPINRGYKVPLFLLMTEQAAQNSLSSFNSSVRRCLPADLMIMRGAVSEHGLRRWLAGSVRNSCGTTHSYIILRPPLKTPLLTWL